MRQEKVAQKEIGNLPGDSLPLLLALEAERVGRPVLLIAENSREAGRLREALVFFAPDLPLLWLPDWEVLPYDRLSPSPETVSERLRTLARLPGLKRGVVVTTLEATLRRMAPPALLLGRALSLRVGDPFPRDRFRELLVEAGYRQVEEVGLPGEFACRGAIFDLFPMGGKEPVRIELFDEEIETLRTFDPESQRSRGKIERFELFPTREFPTDREARERFLHRFAERFPEAIGGRFEQNLRRGELPAGSEAYLPLWLPETATLFDYLPEGTLLFAPQNSGLLERLFGEVEERYRRRRGDLDRPPLPPEELFLTPKEWWERRRAFPSLRPKGAAFPLPERSGEPEAWLRRFAEEHPVPTLFLAERPGRKRALLQLLEEAGLGPVQEVAGWKAFASSLPRFALAVGPLEEGFLAEGLLGRPFAVVPEAALFGARPPVRREARQVDLKQLLDDLQTLRPGAPVVHRHHGVGRYRGLERLVLGGVEGEFLLIEYRGGDLLYVPVTDLHLVARYQGAAGEEAPWHRLGKGEWERARKRAEKRTRDVAAELLALYARRASRKGHALPIDWEAYRRFAQGFPFEETPDQKGAIEAVLEDLQRERPMDRVVCGDVGFGKTEIALRAVFVAAMAGKQVALLVPTTLLAQQHYQTFLDRFADWPVRIEMLSRFVPARRQREILEGLASGRVDIVIGTHRLLQKGVAFRDLGLLIVDEEHRFGVRQKERLKQLRAEVHLLSLTATPIPRTLHMALSGLRDISIIATPPPGRLPIETVVSEWDDALIQEAILRELHRGGQVYFVHNRVETLERVRDAVARLVPEARIGVAHGQMAERELERIMLDFYHQRFDLLLCTTIIESGIDIPNANTILIDRADRLGLAQLHQLRGRVGRSSRQAFAYLLVPPEPLMTREARERLEAIQKASDLGAGFLLSTYDLEIRGAGELLGEAQSGRFEEVGLDLFLEMLQQAVRALKEGEESVEVPEGPAVEVHLHLPTLLPEDYLPDPCLRLKFYRKIALAQSEEALSQLEEELSDRFGPLPEPARFLFEAARIRLLASSIGIAEVEIGEREGRLRFSEKPNLEVERLIELLKEAPQTFQMAGPDRLRFRGDFSEPRARIAWLRGLLERLAPMSGGKR